MTRPTYAYLNSQALKYNIQRVRELAPQQQILAMIKANAYGHGMVQTARALDLADAFGVASIDEAIELRKNNIEKDIWLLGGFFQEEELASIQQQNFSIIIHSAWQIEILEKYPLHTPITTWLKINTGMNRLGVPLSEVRTLWQRLNQLPQIKKPIGLMTHFADADDPKNILSQKQYQCFVEMTQDLPGPRSLANSAAILGLPGTHENWIRPGITLYGVSPYSHGTGLEHNLKPVMTLRSQIIALQHCAANDVIGYSGTYRCPKDMRIGIIAIGYGDGYPRQAPNGTPVLVNNKIAPLVGRVSMDLITVDLSDQPNARVGDSVVVWGEGLPVEIIANKAGTIGYDLLSGVTARVTKVFL